MVSIIDILDSSLSLDLKSKRMVAIIKKNITLLLFIINDIIDYSRIQKGKLKLIPGYF